ncbi:Cadherin-13 [Channa argus]|uniref:Cadherin-13 n=1 Tax=Channa argus TaxID=215402 RepID=A0A6G1PFY8_CHAAH|nr:Cadherin-13 [Channa argus]
MYRVAKLEVSTTDFAGKLVDEPALLLITVIDQNDNRPIFRETRYSGEVLEGSPTEITRDKVLLMQIIQKTPWLLRAVVNVTDGYLKLGSNFWPVLPYLMNISTEYQSYQSEYKS